MVYVVLPALVPWLEITDKVVGFYINLPFGAITGTLLAFVKIPDAKIVSSIKATRKEQVDRLDFPGFAIFTSAIIMLLLAVEWGGASYRWKSPAIIGLLCGAAASTVLFFLWEKRQGDRAMIPLGMLRKPVVFSAAMTSSLSQAGLLLITYYLPVWFQVVKEASPTMGGVCKHILRVFLPCSRSCLESRSPAPQSPTVPMFGNTDSEIFYRLPALGWVASRRIDHYWSFEYACIFPLRSSTDNTVRSHETRILHPFRHRRMCS